MTKIELVAPSSIVLSKTPGTAGAQSGLVSCDEAAESPLAKCPTAIKTERIAQMLSVVPTLGLLVLLWALTVALVPNNHG